MIQTGKYQGNERNIMPKSNTEAWFNISVHYMYMFIPKIDVVLFISAESQFELLPITLDCIEFQ